MVYHTIEFGSMSCGTNESREAFEKDRYELKVGEVLKKKSMQMQMQKPKREGWKRQSTPYFSAIRI
jgi:hypothetical protein